MEYSLLTVPPPPQQVQSALSEIVLLVARVCAVRILFEQRGKHALGREGTAHRKRVSYHSELWLSPHCKHLANIMDESSKVEPVFVRVYFPDPLCCLVAMERVRIIRLQKGRRKGSDFVSPNVMTT